MNLSHVNELFISSSVQNRVVLREYPCPFLLVVVNSKKLYIPFVPKKLLKIPELKQIKINCVEWSIVDMEGGAQYNPRTVEEVFRDFTGRRAGMIKALTTGNAISKPTHIPISFPFWCFICSIFLSGFSVMLHWIILFSSSFADVEDFYQQCDPGSLGIFTFFFHTYFRIWWMSLFLSLPLLSVFLLTSFANFDRIWLVLSFRNILQISKFLLFVMAKPFLFEINKALTCNQISGFGFWVKGQNNVAPSFCFPFNYTKANELKSKLLGSLFFAHDSVFCSWLLFVFCSTYSVLTEIFFYW